MSLAPGDDYYFLILIIFLFAIIILLLRSLYKIHKGAQSNSWKAVKATVVDIKIDSNSDDDGYHWYTPKIRYCYLVSEVFYTSNNYSYKSIDTRSYGEITRQLCGVTKRTVITAYVNPYNPRQAVVVPGTNWSNYMEVFIQLVASVFIMIGIREHLIIVQL